VRSTGSQVDIATEPNEATPAALPGAALAALTFAAERFLRSDTIEGGLADVAAYVGASCGATRVRILENTHDSAGTLIATPRHTWARPGSRVQASAGWIGPYRPRLVRWLERFEAGGTVSALSRELPGDERTCLEGCGVKSLALVPIRVGPIWWGLLGLEQLEWERSWDRDIVALQAVANIIGSAIERQSAFDQLRQSEEVIQSAFSSMSTGILVTDLEGRLLLANRQAVACLLAEVDGPWQGCKLTDLLPGASPLLREADANQRTQADVALPSGRVLRIGYSTTRATSGARKVTVFRDLSPILEMEQRRRRAEQLAQVGSMAARLSHEIKNPLAGLFACLQLLEREATLPPQHFTVLQDALEEVRRLSRTVYALLNAARPAPLAPERVGLGAIMREGVLAHATSARLRNIQIEIVPSEGNPTILIDSGAFRRILDNLVVNAMEAVGKGGRLEVGWRKLTGDEVASRFPGFPGDGVASFFVRDDGPGLGGEQVEKIFEPFYTTKATGTGLGLAVVLELVRLHGGVLEVRSRRGTGSVFEVFVASADGWPEKQGSCACGGAAGGGVERGARAACCWAVKGEASLAESGRWPEQCLSCGTFQHGVLHEYYGRLLGVRQDL
jgi:signal transduction histidine kinase